ncbi:ROK family protein [Eubacteriales bacterium OttesenSCG-928-N13]|nr:ROK family protein [Eubacteriales bacterium OttesenSCG-928-N13]
MGSHVLGIDIGGTSVKLGIVQDGQEIVWRKQIAFVKGDADQMLSRIAQAASEGIKQYHVSHVGVSVAGKVSPKRGTTQADNLGWMDVPVRHILRKKLSLPVWMENDAQCAMLAEWRSGACQGVSNVAYLTYGTGIGGGMIIQGKPYRGRSHSGGEFGHVITHGGANARRCTCGHRGCYETYASTTALKRMMGNKYSVRQIVDGAKAGKPLFVKAFDAYMDELVLGLVSVMAVLSPEMLVLGGGLSNAGDFFLDSVHAHMAHLEDWLMRPTQVVLAKYGNDAGMLGAAAMADLHFRQS